MTGQPAALTLRAALPADGPELSRLLPSDPEDPRAGAAFPVPAGGADADTTLVAVEEDTIVGALAGSFTEVGYRIQQIRARPGALARATAAFLDALPAWFPGQRIEARLTGARADEALHEALLRAGAALVLDQIVFERDLRDFEGAGADPFTVRPYAETGRAALADLLARIFAGDGGSGRATADPAREVDRLVHDGAGADGALDARLWCTAYVDEEPIGVALARLRDDRAHTGTLAYLGLVPEARGQGMGRALHAAALRRLAAAGAKRYEGATGVDNQAMRRILEQNGCRPCGSARHYLVHAEVTAGHLADFEELIAYLASERYAAEILKPGEWARVEARFGRHAATIDVGWLRDARLVQVVHAYPDPVPGARLADAARAVGALNATLNVPGFILDEKARTLSFRLPLHLDEEGGASLHQLRRVLASVVAAVSTYRAWSRDVILAPPEPRRLGSLVERVPLRRPG